MDKNSEPLQFSRMAEPMPLMRRVCVGAIVGAIGGLLLFRQEKKVSETVIFNVNQVLLKEYRENQ